MHVRFWDLGNREVVNCKDGKRLGHVGDVEIDLTSGCITSFFIPAGSKYCGCFVKKGEYRFPYCAVVKIGVDIILVDIDEKKCLEK
ncbi:MAG: YlmC/YmxH family sporulation protein [Clostridiales bacterium]|nr:YlmC/YmxH family sporulation protein [Clostridiales bacterium]